MPPRPVRSNPITCGKREPEDDPARDEFASFCDLYGEKSATSAVDGNSSPDCNTRMGRRARRALARRLKVLRTLRGWTQEDLADASGLHRTYVSLIERGECNVGIDNIERLAEAFDIHLMELFGMMEAWALGRPRRRGTSDRC